MSGPMPEHFRWLWYLVGLAGMSLTVLGALALIGSIIAEGLVVPVVVIVVAATGGGIAWRRRRHASSASRGPAAGTDQSG